jgi:hypothetical protein
MNQPKISWLLTGLLAFCYTGPGLAQEVSLRSLLQEMTSRETVAQFPSPAYTCRQASSYDRDSVSPDDQTTWYARPGATCNVKPDPAMATQSVAKAITDLVPPLHVEGALEGESLQVLDKTGGVVEVQTATPLGWSDDRQLWWRDGKIGNRLVLEFPVEKAGRYRITANLTKAVDYAIIKLQVGDQPAGQFDRYHQTVKHDPLELGLFDLPRGKGRLTVEIVDMNQRGVPRHMFGIDYLKLEPVE